MAELFEAVASWPTLLLVLLVFGFAPGFVLRLLVLAYPRGDPRRTELIAELYAVPRSHRPLWVAEQLEVALFEGLARRVSAALRRLTGRRRARAQTDERGMPVALGLGFGLVGVGVFLGVIQFDRMGGLWFALTLTLGFGLVLVGVARLVGRFRSKRWPPR